MNYIIHYDIAAIVISITTAVHFFHKKTIQTKPREVFTILLTLTFLTGVFDLISIALINHSNTVHLFFNYVFNQMYLIAFNTIPPLYYIYLVLVTKEKLNFNQKERIIMLVPITIASVLVLTTPWTRAIFYFDENRMYQHGPFMIGLYLIALFYVGGSLLHTYRYRRILTKAQQFIVYFYTVSCFITVAVQMVISGLLIAQFAVAISVLLIYLSLENPADYEDKQLGTYNKVAFQKVVATNIDDQKRFEVLGVQIEGMRYINETIGATSGNHLMKQFTGFLMQIAQKRQVFYLDGYRFAIISEGRKEDWDELIASIHKRFQMPFYSDNVQITLTAPMCVISYPDNVHRFEDMMDMIEYAIDEAKAEGDQSVVYAGEQILERGRRENQILQIMKQALREGTFEVFYQPIFSVEKQCFTSAEALIRLRHEELGFISPDEFIPMAEKNGMILEIGEFVFREVCRFLSQEKLWEKGIEYIDVNLSVVQCMQESLYENLLHIMDEYGLLYQYINLEITETAAVMSRETLESNMTKLMKLGVNFSLDDYGTGFSNTASIIEYPFHTVKIDKSMVWSAMENEKAMCALKYSIAMIKAMHMELIAEGVETEQQVGKLTDMGCDFFQGYHYSKPVDKQEFIRKIVSMNTNKKE